MKTMKQGLRRVFFGAVFLSASTQALAIDPSHCISLDDGTLTNTCNKPLTVAWCGNNPWGNSTMNCARGKGGMAGLYPGNSITVQDKYGGYDSIRWVACRNTPSNVRFSASGISVDNCQN